MYLVFDTETTGLPKNFNAPVSDSENWPRMVQISWQLHDDYGNLIENQDYIIKPEGYDIPFNVAKIHGITTELAHKEGRDLVEVLNEFNEVLKKTKFGVGHNIEFDYNIVGAEFFRKQIKTNLAELPQADTMHLGTDFCAIPTKGGKFKKPKLGELYEILYGEKFAEAHNAAADVNATAQVFFEMLRRDIIHPSDLKVDEKVIEELRKNNPEPIQPFDIVIRRQVEALRDKQKKSKIDGSNIDLGQYFNFHNHSIYSSLQASSSLSDLVNNALENNFPAVGMVDLGNMMGAFKFISEVEGANAKIKSNYEQYLEESRTESQEPRLDNQEKGEGEQAPKVKSQKPTAKSQPPRKEPLIPILGCEFYISDRPEQKQFTKDDPDRRTRMVLLAKNFNGYKNLAKLSSLGFVNGFYFGVPRISREMINEYKEDLIALSSGIGGDIPNTILEFGEQRGEELFKWWHDTFGDDFYVQIQNHKVDDEEYVNSVLLKWAEKYNTNVLAQNETYYTNQDDAKIQDILFCIKDGEKLSTEVGRGYGKRNGLPTTEFHLKNRDELKQAFAHYPNAFADYEQFVQKFSPYTLKRDVLLPEFAIPEQFQSEEDKVDGGKRGENAYLRHLTYEGAKQRYDEITPEISERLDFELEVIANTGYPGYFLIVQDFCNEARKMGVWVGPGRGSAAGSAVAYCIGITNIDPIEYDLLFERFLNPERVSMPDIDIDFDDDGRDKIIKWVVEKYGKTNVAQIITYSVLGGKSAIKDAGRVLDMPIPDTNNIAKLIPPSPGMNIAKSFKKYDKLQSEDKALVDEMKSILNTPEDDRHEVLSSAQKMEGCIRNTGIHACGVIITPEDISNLVPISIAAKDADILVSQFDNSVAEDAGLLKMDFLGLKTLSIIKDAIQLVKENHGIEIDPDKIPLDDEKTYQLFQEGRTVGVFQYESPGMQKYMRELKPTVFPDLIAMNALYRPGPIQYIPNFINRKHGTEEIVYDLPECEEYLAETYGITVYQEQVMLLSQKLANFTKGEADTLRKAMGKKKIKELEKLYPKFIQQGKDNNLDEEKLNKIWNDWKAFAEYAFNKSHSTCYAFVAYQTAYMKANYPAEYMASVMTHNLNNTSSITMFMEDCKSMGVDVLGPDVNESQYQFAVNEKGQIRFGLGAIKGIGEGPSEAIVETRKEGKFTSIFDFFERVPSSQVNKRVVESLVLGGGFDELDQFHRAQYFDIDDKGKTNIEKLLKYGQGVQESKNEIENSLFADFADEVKIEEPTIKPSDEWGNMHKLNKEKEVLGFYISSHPLDEFKYQFEFMQGLLSKKEILETQNIEDLLPTPIVDLVEDEIEDVEFEMDDDDEVEEEQELIEPKGSFNFLNLDQIDKLREQVFTPTFIQQFLDIKDYKKKRAMNDNSKIYTVAGLITEYTVRDGYNSGEKVAFLTLEDYSGSYSFRLGDRDYMKLREELDLHRFVILKTKFSIAKDGRVFLNVVSVSQLKDAFEDFAKSVTVVMDIADLRKEDIDFFRQNFNNSGAGKLNFYIKDEQNKSHIELNSVSFYLDINEDTVAILSNQTNHQFYLN